MSPVQWLWPLCVLADWFQLQLVQQTSKMLQWIWSPSAGLGGQWMPGRGTVKREDVWEDRARRDISNYHDLPHDHHAIQGPDHHQESCDISDAYQPAYRRWHEDSPTSQRQWSLHRWQCSWEERRNPPCRPHCWNSHLGPHYSSGHSGDSVYVSPSNISSQHLLHWETPKQMASNEVSKRLRTPCLCRSWTSWRERRFYCIRAVLKF